MDETIYQIEKDKLPPEIWGHKTFRMGDEIAVEATQFNPIPLYFGRVKSGIALTIDSMQLISHPNRLMNGNTLFINTRTKGMRVAPTSRIPRIDPFNQGELTDDALLEWVDNALEAYFTGLKNTIGTIPVVAGLSGGVDCFLTNVYARRAGLNVWTVTIAPPDELKASTSDYLGAVNIAEVLGWDLHEIQPTKMDNLDALVKGAFRAMQFTGDLGKFFGAFGDYLLTRQAVDMGGVVLGGSDALAHADKRIHGMEFASYQPLNDFQKQVRNFAVAQNCAYLGFLNSLIKWPSTFLSPEAYMAAQIAAVMGTRHYSPFMDRNVALALAKIHPLDRLNGPREKPVLRKLMREIEPKSGWDAKKMYFEDWSLSVRKERGIDPHSHPLSKAGIKHRSQAVRSKNPTPVGYLT